MIENGHDDAVSGGLHVEIPSPRGVEPVPVFEGRRTRLRPMRPDDYDFLHYLHSAPEMLVRYRLRGGMPSPDQAAPVLYWQGTLVQFVVERKDEPEPIGVVSAYNTDYKNGVTSMAVAVVPRYEAQGWALEAGFIFVEYLFEVFNFRKIYLESLEFNFKQFAAGAGGVFVVEGCLRNHEFYRGRYWHLYLMAIYRDQWPAVAERYLGRPTRIAMSGDAPPNTDDRDMTSS